MSIAYQIETNLQTLLAAATFNGIDPANIQVGELPKADQQISGLPCIRIAPAGDNTDKPNDMGGGHARTYTREICAIDATEGDTQTDQAKYEGWLEKIVQVITADQQNGFPPSNATLPHCPSVWYLSVDKAPTLDRGKLNQLYAYQSVLVTFHSYE